ncbi:MAG: hypothetical protein M0D57_19100 [Sphingobacteriales bacterium JAD_PAG50586_3]|nr:MAG: hypothetical protein M0D57_19100 [Sphingobacteriales bacterium JAD_PAG50586_3]
MRILFACLAVLLIAFPASAQRHKKNDVANPCAIPLPINERPDTITKYIFGMTDKTIAVKSIPKTKPKDNNILHSKYGTISWHLFFTKDISRYVNVNMKPYHITDTLEITFGGIKHTILEIEDNKIKGYLAYQDINGENEFYFFMARTDKKRKALLKIAETYFK